MNDGANDALNELKELCRVDVIFEFKFEVVFVYLLVYGIRCDILNSLSIVNEFEVFFSLWIVLQLLFLFFNFFRCGKDLQRPLLALLIDQHVCALAIAAAKAPGIAAAFSGFAVAAVAVLLQLVNVEVCDS